MWPTLRPRPWCLAVIMQMGAGNRQHPCRVGHRADQIEHRVVAARAVLPSGRPRIARRWFSNWLVSAPSMLQCPELCTRGANSLASSARRRQRTPRPARRHGRSLRAGVRPGLRPPAAADRWCGRRWCGGCRCGGGFPPADNRPRAPSRPRAAISDTSRSNGTSRSSNAGVSPSSRAATSTSAAVRSSHWPLPS